MMSEELDFEAEIPVSANGKSLDKTEYPTEIIVKKEFPDENISEKVSPKRNSTEERNLLNEVNTLQSHTEEVNLCLVKKEPSTEMETSVTQNKESDSEERKSETGEIESDTGEIHSDNDEIPNSHDDLEEGELDDDGSVQIKASEVACRFYQRGTCLYGSECRNAHISNGVYNMFDPHLSNKSHFRPFGVPNFHRPPVFPPNMPPPLPEIESPWERGIKKAKIIMHNVNMRKSDDFELESDWERCLEEAKANIRSKQANAKRNVLDDEKEFCEAKYSKQERFRERSPVISYNGLIKESHKQNHSKDMYSKYENKPNYDKRTKSYEVESTPDHLKWVDPWQRSKSPKRRTRSISFSVSPSPPLRDSRERSISTSSSASSYFEQIYKGTGEVKSSAKRSRSKSHSMSPPSKKTVVPKSHSYSRKRSYSRSNSRSYSKSPRKRFHSGSSSERSEKLYRSHDFKRSPQTSSKERFNKNEKRYPPGSRTNDGSRPSASKSYKTRRLSSQSRTTSMSSLSCTSVSSLSDIDDIEPPKSSEAKERKALVKDEVPFQKKLIQPFRINQRNRENNLSATSVFCKRPEELNHIGQRKYSPDKLSRETYNSSSKESNRIERKKYSPEKSSRATYNTSSKNKSTDGKTSVLQSASANQTTKHTMNDKVPNHTPSADELTLLRFSSLRQVNRSYPLNPVKEQSKSPLSEFPKSKDDVLVRNAVTKDNVPSQICSDVTSKSHSNKPNVTVKDEKNLSKRRMLMQQLQAIEDAIARKKGKN